MSIVTWPISYSVGQQSLRGDTKQIRTWLRLRGNIHIAFGSESLLRSHLSESTTKGSPEKREVGDTNLTVMGVCGKV